MGVWWSRKEPGKQKPDTNVVWGTQYHLLNLLAGAVETQTVAQSHQGVAGELTQQTIFC